MLGLSVNTRMIGMAVMKENTLVDYYVSLRKEAWSPQKKDKFLASLKPWITSYTISSVALAIPYEHHTTKEIKELLECIKECFAEKNIPVYSYHRKSFHLLYEDDQPKTKKMMMYNLCNIYPELSRYYHREIRNRNRYYTKLFEAVALANIHSKELQQRL